MSGQCQGEEPVAGRGTYSLIVAVSESTRATVGSLGDVAFDAGWYAYTGSALGPGGFARLDRHREVATGQRSVRHWHVDTLLGLDESTVDRDFRSPGVDGECAIAGETADLVGDQIPGFGATDCDCESHLFVSPRRDELLASVARAHEAVADSRHTG